jgi:TPR repeat protein
LLVEGEATKARERKEAFAFYRTAAEGGHLGGIFRLGLCYSRAYGVERNYSAAQSLLGIAAKRGYEGAEEELSALKARKHRRAARRFYSISSVLYRKGNVAEAVKFRNIAAKLGSARAMLVLGCHYEFGDGVEEDRVKANAWYSRAIAAGVDMGRVDLKGAYLRERKKLTARA